MTSSDNKLSSKNCKTCQPPSKIVCLEDPEVINWDLFLESDECELLSSDDLAPEEITV